MKNLPIQIITMLLSCLTATAGFGNFDRMNIIGSSVIYSITIQDLLNGKIRKQEMVSVLTSENHKKYTLSFVNSIYEAGQKTIVENSNDSLVSYYDVHIENILDEDCGYDDFHEAEYEKITVRGITFETCRYDFISDDHLQKESIWLGKVRFGIVKDEIDTLDKSGNIILKKIIEYKREG